MIDFDENAKDCYFVLKSDGRGWEHLCKKAGGYKIPSSEATKIEVSDENGNIRSAENLYMNGAEIFNFTLLEQPPLIDEILAFSNLIKKPYKGYYSYSFSSDLLVSCESATLPS